MKKVLVDSSVWIAFFKGENKSLPLIELIDSNLVCVNDLILAELIPAMYHRKEWHLIELFSEIECIEMRINWPDIIDLQKKNLSAGINNVGIPDLIIAQNAIYHQVPLYTFDKHFQLMSKNFNLTLF
ncbi:MAG: PIN domain-containing protein [bacterium]